MRFNLYSLLMWVTLAATVLATIRNVQHNPRIEEWVDIVSILTNHYLKGC